VNATANASLTVTGSSITGSGAAGIADGGSGAQIFIVASDHISGQPGAALALNGFNGNVQGVILNTVIGNGSAGSGSGSGDGVDLADASGQFILEADANTIGQIAHGVGFSVAQSGASEVDLTFGNGVSGNANTIQGLGASSLNAFSFAGGAGMSCLNASANTITSAGSGTFAMSLSAGAGAFSIQGLGGAAVDTFLGSTNTLTGQSTAVQATGTFSSAAGTCPTPSVLNITS